MNETDASLIKRWVDQRDAAAFEEVMRRYAGLVYGTAKRVLGNETEAEDVAQECFVRLSSADAAVTEHLGGWLHRVATNHAISKLRSEKRRHQREEHFAKETPAAHTVTWDDLQEFVDDAINQLSAESRSLIVAYFLQKRTQESLAEEFGVSRQAVSHRIGKGVEEIRFQLKRKGVIVSAAAFETLLLSHPADAVPAAFAANLAKLAIAGGRLGAPAASMAALSSWWPIAIVAVLAVGGFLAYTTGVFRTNDPERLAAPLESTTGDQPETATGLEDLGLGANQQGPQALAVDTNITPVVPPASTAAVMSGTVLGRVVDAATQSPLAKVGLVISGVNDETNHTVTSDTNGDFRLDALVFGEYTISVSDLKYAVASAEPTFTLAAETPERELVLALVPRGSVKGRVYDQDSNTGIPGVLITANRLLAPPQVQTDEGGAVSLLGYSIESNSIETDTTPVAYTALTDKDGVFAFDGLKEGMYELSREEVQGYVQIVQLTSEDVRTITVSSEDVRGNADFPLSRGGGIAGRVTLAGQPIANATFDLVCYVRPGREDDQIVKTIPGVRTDASGSYAVEKLPVFEEPGLFMLRQTSPARADFESLKEAAYIKSGGVTEVDFQFTGRTAQLNGRVLTSTGEPLRAQFIGADTVYGVAQTRYRGTTDDNGHFQVQNLPSTQVHFNFMIDNIPGYRTLNVVLEEGQRVSHDVIVHNTAVQCQILNIPTNSAFVMLEVYPADYNVPPGTDIVSLNERSDVQLLRVLPDGETGLIQGVAPGTYTVVAYSSTVSLETNAEVGMDYNKLLKESREVLQAVTLAEGAAIDLVFDFNAP